MKKFVRRVKIIEQMAKNLPHLGEFLFTFGRMTSEWKTDFKDWYFTITF